MKNQRQYQIASIIREALAPMLVSVCPGGLVTVRQVLLSANYGVATIAYTIVGEQLSADEAQKQLDEIAPTCRLQLARVLNMRKTPRLVFRHDEEGLAADKMRDFLETIDASEDD